MTPKPTLSLQALTSSLSEIFTSETEFRSDAAASSLRTLPSHLATTICSQHMPPNGDKATDVLRGLKKKSSIIMQELRESLLETPFALLSPGTFGKPVLKQESECLRAPKTLDWSSCIPCLREGGPFNPRGAREGPLRT